MAYFRYHTPESWGIFMLYSLMHFPQSQRPHRPLLGDVISYGTLNQGNPDKLRFFLRFPLGFSLGLRHFVSFAPSKG